MTNSRGGSGPVDLALARAAYMGVAVVARPARRSAPHAGQKRNGAGTERWQEKQALTLSPTDCSMFITRFPHLCLSGLSRRGLSSAAAVSLQPHRSPQPAT